MGKKWCARSTVFAVNNPDLMLSLVLRTDEILVDVDVIFDRVRQEEKSEKEQKTQTP